MRRLGIRSIIVLALVATLSAAAMPADAWSTSVTRTPRFDFGCKLELYGERTRTDGRCLRNDEQALQGHLRSRVVPSVGIHSYSLLAPPAVRASTLSDSTGLIINAPAPSNMVATVVARGTQASVSPFSGLRLCLAILNRDSDGYGGLCQAMAADRLTTMTTTFEGFSLNGSESPYRLIVFLEGTGRAAVRSISYRLEGA